MTEHHINSIYMCHAVTEEAEQTLLSIMPNNIP